MHNDQKRHYTFYLYIAYIFLTLNIQILFSYYYMFVRFQFILSLYAVLLLYEAYIFNNRKNYKKNRILLFRLNNNII